MEAANQDLARSIWRQLVQRNQWQLFPNEEALFERLLAQLQSDGAAQLQAETLRSTFQRIYSERLYQGIQRREERAAYELWLMFLRLAVRGGATVHDADDLAQEAMARVLAKISQVKTPGSFLAWTMMVFRTTERDLRPKREERSLIPDQDKAAIEPIDPADLVAEVEDRLVNQAFRDLLKTTLPNNLERLTLLRCIVFGDEPCDVARDLGLPLHRTRVAKSRALQRLRTNIAFLRFIAALDPAHQATAPIKGGQRDE